MLYSKVGNFLRRLFLAARNVASVLVLLALAVGFLYLLVRSSAWTIQSTTENGKPFLGWSVVVILWFWILGAGIVQTQERKEEPVKQEDVQEQQ